MDHKASVPKSELSETIDNLIKEEQKEVKFVSVYEKLGKFLKFNCSAGKGMSSQGWPC